MRIIGLISFLVLVDYGLAEFIPLQLDLWKDISNSFSDSIGAAINAVGGLINMSVDYSWLTNNASEPNILSAYNPLNALPVNPLQSLQSLPFLKLRGNGLSDRVKQYESMSIDELKTIFSNARSPTVSRIPRGLANGRVIKNFSPINIQSSSISTLDTLVDSTENYFDRITRHFQTSLWRGKFFMETMCNGNLVRWYMNLYDNEYLSNPIVNNPNSQQTMLNPGAVTIGRIPNEAVWIDDKMSYLFDYEPFLPCNGPHNDKTLLTTFNPRGLDNLIDDVREIENGIFLAFVYNKDTWKLVQIWVLESYELLTQ